MEMPKLDWSNPDQTKAFNEWRDFLRSYLEINKVKKKDQWHYIMLSAGREGKDLWDLWQLNDTTKKESANEANSKPIILDVDTLEKIGAC